MSIPRTLFFCAGMAVLSVSGCRQQTESTSGNALSSNAPPPVNVQFTDITKSAGIRFTHNNGATGLMLMPETNGSGVAFLDYDGDGYQDLFFVNARDWTPAEARAARDHFPSDSHLKSLQYSRRHPKPTSSALYRNNGNGTFSDVTSNSGLGVVTYGMGAAVGDYDNDGLTDLYLTGYPRNYLFRNEGGKFRDVTASAGVRDSGWSMSAAWLDYDKDGVLDLFVSHYFDWSPETDVYQFSERRKAYSNPTAYEGQVSRLYRGTGNGRFRDVSAEAGIIKSLSASGKTETFKSKGMGVAVCDYNNDGWPDILVANDTQRNHLFENKANGKFEEVAVRAGIAHDQFGRPRAGMGIDTADIDHSNHDSVVIGNFAKEMLGLYYNDGAGAFADMAPQSEVGAASRAFLTFGCAFFDYDNDGWPDIVAGNGHVQPHTVDAPDQMGAAQRPLLFRNQTGAGRLQFEEVGLRSGAGFSKPLVARGLAYSDIDLDGDLDLVMTSNGGAARLLRNDGGNKNHAIRLTLQGTKSNRSGIGALIKAKIGNDVLRLWARSGSSYLSQSELPLTLGLGQHKQADGIAIRWPSGAVTKLENVAANQMIVVNEEKGIVEQKPFPQQHK